MRSGMCSSTMLLQSLLASDVASLLLAAVLLAAPVASVLLASDVLESVLCADVQSRGSGSDDRLRLLLMSLMRSAGQPKEAP